MSRRLITCSRHGEQPTLLVDGEPTCFVCWDRARRCECGCGRSLAGFHRRAKYVNERHKQRVYRRKLEAAAAAAGVPTSLSLKTLETATATDERHGDAKAGVASARRAPSKPRKPSLRISYRKAVDAFAAWIAGTTLLDEFEQGDGDWIAREWAEDVLKPVLTDRQRAAL